MDKILLWLQERTKRWLYGVRTCGTKRVVYKGVVFLTDLDFHSSNMSCKIAGSNKDGIRGA